MGANWELFAQTGAAMMAVRGRCSAYFRVQWSDGGEKMNEDVFNASIRKFLKTLGVSAQREIEKAVRQALADGKLKGTETLPAHATVTIAGIDLAHEIKGEIELE